ncbi:hypothetical protein, partial [Paraliobacillus quinghaiensis]
MSRTHVGLDNDFTNYIENNNFEMTIFTEFALPYYLLINSGFFTFEADENFIISESNKKRKVAFRIQSFYRDEQKVPLRESTFKIKPNKLSTESYTYGVFNSIIQVAIQSFNSEKELINTKLQEKESDFTTDINQAFLEYILFRYNETTEGNHVIVFVNIKLSHSDHFKSEPLYTFHFPVMGENGSLGSIGPSRAN